MCDAGGRQHALRCRTVLDPERDAVERPAPRRCPRASSAAAAICERLLRRLDDEGVERPRRLDRGDIGLGHLARGERLARAARRAPRRGSRSVSSDITRSPSARRKSPSRRCGRIGQHRVAAVAVGHDVVAHRQRIAATLVIGATPSVSTSASCSTQVSRFIRSLKQ